MKETYNHTLYLQLYSEPSVELKPIENMTQGKQYEILNEIEHRPDNWGMLFLIENDIGEKRYVSDKYFYPLKTPLDFKDKLEGVLAISSSFSFSSSLPELGVVDHSIEGAVLLYQRLLAL
jgi:hypothetical protein